MIYYQIGQDKEEVLVPDGCEWCIVEYESGDYDGDGTAICKVGNNLFCKQLDHCSCFGPSDNDRNWEPAEHPTEYSEKMQAKIEELLGTLAAENKKG